MKKISKVIAGMGLVAVAPFGAASDWSFGIGTGIGGLAMDGKAGFESAYGTVVADFDIGADDVREYTETAFGFGGFAKKDKFKISYSVAKLELEDDLDVVQDGNIGRLDVNYESTQAEVLVAYTFSNSDSHEFSVIGGLRYTEKEYDGSLTVAAVTTFDGSVDEDWTDAVVGIGHKYVISPTLSWTTQLDYGVGGSDGAAHFNTGINKVFGTSWLLRGFVDYIDTEYENGNEGDSDWFLYEVDETKVGVSFLYLF